MGVDMAAVPAGRHDDGDGSEDRRVTTATGQQTPATRTTRHGSGTDGEDEQAQDSRTLNGSSSIANI